MKPDPRWRALFQPEGMLALLVAAFALVAAWNFHSPIPAVDFYPS